MATCIAHHTNHGHLFIVFTAWIEPLQSSTNRILAGPIAPCQRFIHDSYRGRIRSIVVCEIATLQERNPHCLEIVTSNFSPNQVRPALDRLGRPPFDLSQRPGTTLTKEEQIVDPSGRLDSWHCRDALQHLAKKRDLSRCRR